MARAVVFALAVCCLLVAPAPARRTADLSPLLPDAVDREAAAEPLLPKAAAADCAEEADQATALTVPEEGAAIAVREGPQQGSSSLLCLVFRCGGEPAGAVVARASSEEPAALDGWTRPAGKAAVEKEDVDDGQEGPYNSDSDSDWDSDSDDEDSDSDDEDGIMGWFWRLAHLF